MDHVNAHLVNSLLFVEYQFWGISDFRERPFNLKGGYGFFLKKYSDSQCCWKKYSDFGGGKKKSDSEFLSYNLMLNSGKKICALRDKINKYSNSRVVGKQISEQNKKP